MSSTISQLTFSKSTLAHRQSRELRIKPSAANVLVYERGCVPVLSMRHLLLGSKASVSCRLPEGFLVP